MAAPAAQRTALKICPICHTAMVATKSDSKLDQDDTHVCLRCGTVMVVSPEPAEKRL